MRIVPEEVLADWSETEDGWLAPRPPAGGAARCPRTPWTEFNPGDESVGEESVETLSSDEPADDEESDGSLPALEPIEESGDEHVGDDPVDVSDDDESADDAPMPAATAAAAGLQAKARPTMPLAWNSQPQGHAFHLAATVPREPWVFPAPVHPCRPCMPVPMPPWTPMPCDMLPAPVASPFSYLPQVPPPPRPPRPQQSSSEDLFADVRHHDAAADTREKPPPIRRPPSYPPKPFYQQPPPIRPYEKQSPTPSYEKQSPIRRPPSRTQGGSPLAGGYRAPFYGEETDEVRAKRVISELRYNARAYELAVLNDGWIAFDELRSLRWRSVDDLDAIIRFMNIGKKRVEYYYHYAEYGVVSTVSLRILWSPKTPWVHWDSPKFQYGK